MNPLRENLSVRKGNAYERADTEMAAAVKGVRSGCDDCGVRYASGIQGISGPSGRGQTNQPPRSDTAVPPRFPPGIFLF